MVKQSGFTLVELIVVISIIGILSATIFAGFGNARNEARNRAMMAEFKEVQLALTLYRSQNGSYPANVNSLVPEFISVIPVPADSGNPNCSINYQTGPSNSWYKLTGIRCFAGATDAASGIQQDEEMARCPSSCPATGVCDPSQATFYESFAVFSNGGECQ